MWLYLKKSLQNFKIQRFFSLKSYKNQLHSLLPKRETWKIYFCIPPYENDTKVLDREKIRKIYDVSIKETFFFCNLSSPKSIVHMTSSQWFQSLSHIHTLPSCTPAIDRTTSTHTVCNSSLINKVDKSTVITIE